MFVYARAGTGRDPRIDILRGVALLMIFVDHIPADWLNRITLHNFGFSDAAELFVLLAGMSSTLAYGKIFDRDGMQPALRRILLRCGRIYLFQIGLLLSTRGVVLVAFRFGWVAPRNVRQPLAPPGWELIHGLTLTALPTYLDILPLYIVLMAAFPFVYAMMRRRAVLALGLSALLWLTTQVVPTINLPNRITGLGWYFDPFAWQFLFAIGTYLALLQREQDRTLPNPCAGLSQRER
jgi:hypothetical protein